MNNIINFILTLLLVSSCVDQESMSIAQTNTTDIQEEIDDLPINVGSSDLCSNPIVTGGKYYMQDGLEYLWGGSDPSTHFDITGWGLDPCKLFYGLGREHFKVPETPKFVSMSEVSENHDDLDKFIVLEGKNGVKIYPYSEIVNSEMVNDFDGTNAIMVVYCFLADLAVVYSRNYNGQIKTFGVSGYTYSDPNISDGLESFVLWDRETESLWWPIIDKGVSGAFENEPMVKYQASKWDVKRWSEIKDPYLDAQVYIYSGSSNNSLDDI